MKCERRWNETQVLGQGSANCFAYPERMCFGKINKDLKNSKKKYETLSLHVQCICQNEIYLQLTALSQFLKKDCQFVVLGGGNKLFNSG